MSKDNKDLVEETKDTKKDSMGVAPMSTPMPLAAEGEDLTNHSSTHGTTLEYSKDKGTTWIKVANLINVTPPAVAADEFETTDHDSKGWKEFGAGLKDGGEVPLNLNVKNEENITDLYALVASGDTVQWRIDVPTKPNKFKVTFNGFMKSFNLDELPANPKAVTATGAIRVSGKPTYGFAEGGE